MTSTVRSVRVVMNAEVAKYVADMRLAGTETRKAFNATSQKKFNTELATTQQQLTGVTRGLDTTSQKTRQVDNDTQRLSRSLQRGSNDLNKYTGRLSALVKGAAVLAPTLVPIATTAVPAIAGLTAGLGAVAGAMGVVLLASNGMGDALKALNAYQLDPTVQNLQKLHQTMAALGPDGREFVQLLDSLEPQLRALQNTARAGLFPGAEDSIGHLLGLLPQLRSFVATFSTELGSLAAEGGRSLANDSDWQKFFTYLETDGAPIMDDFARATGNVTAGLASMLRDFAPLERDFSAELEHWSESFRSWADGLDQTQGFEHFIDDIRSATPEVLGFLKALGQAIIALAQATAPWASTVLPILTDVLKLFTALAGSPIGPVIYDAAAALIVFRTASAWLGVGGLAGVTGGGLLGTLDKARTGFRGMAADIKVATMSLTDMTAAERAFNVEGSAAASAQVFARNSLATSLLRGAAPVAGIGGTLLLANGIGNKNKTASALENIGGGALLGASIGTTLAPGVGTAAGAAIGALSGALLTLATHLHTTSDSVKQVTVDWSNLTATLDGNGRPTDQTRTSIGQALIKNGLLNAANSAGISDTATLNAATGDQASLAALTAASKAKQAQLQAQLDKLTGAGGGPNYSMIAAASGNGAEVAKQTGALKQQIQAQKDLQSNVAKAASTIDEEEASQRRLQAAMGSSTLSIKEQIAAQESLHQQTLANFDATTAYGQAMQALAKQAGTAEKGFDQFTKAGVDNRQAVSDAIQTYNGQSQAVKNNVKGYEQMSSALITFLQKMGASKQQIATFTAQIDKPHKLVANVDADRAISTVKQLKQLIDELRNKTVTLNVKRIDSSGAGNAALNAQHSGRGHADGGLIGRPALRRAAIAPQRFADGGLAARAGLKKPLFTHEGPKYYAAAYAHNAPFAKKGPGKWDWPYQTGLTQSQENKFERWVDTKHVPFDVSARKVDYDMRGYWKATKGKGWHEGSHFPDTYKTPYDTTFSAESKYATKDNPFHWKGNKLIDQRNGQIVFAAGGGRISGPGGPRDDLIPAYLSNGEFVVNAATTARLLPWLEQENAKGYADGGQVGNSLTGGSFNYPLDAGALSKQAAAQAKASSKANKDATDATKKLTKTQLEAIAAGAKANAELKHLSVSLHGIPKDVRKPLRQLLDGSALAGVSLKDLNKASRLLNKSLTDTKSQLSDVQSQRDSLQSSITSGLSRDLWTGPTTGTGNVWTQSTASGWTPQYAISQLNGITTDATEFDKLRQQVEQNGIKGTALNELEANGGLQALRAFAASPALSQQYQQAYTAAFGDGKKNPGAVGATANAAGKDLYGKKLDHIHDTLKDLRGDVKNVEKAVNDKTKVDDASRAKHAQATADGVAKGVGKAATSGHKKATATQKKHLKK